LAVAAIARRRSTGPTRQRGSGNGFRLRAISIVLKTFFPTMPKNPTMAFVRRESGECRLKSIGIWQVMKIAALSMLCALVVSCVLAPLPGDLPSARETCNRVYPRRVGNYLPHAQCVNAAVERYALPTASHPDLIRLQEGVRAALSDKVDRRRISASAGERRMAEADRLVAVAERERDAGNDAAAARRVAAIEEMLR
jgi:hypothetical protein